MNEIVEKWLLMHDSNAAAARSIGADPSTVGKWLRGTRKVSWRFALKIENSTLGLIRAIDLRPDLKEQYDEN